MSLYEILQDHSENMAKMECEYWPNQVIEPAPKEIADQIEYFHANQEPVPYGFWQYNPRHHGYCEQCHGSGYWATECCAGWDCPCQGQEVYMGMCQGCEGTGKHEDGKQGANLSHLASVIHDGRITK